jgi:hypothetical protein
MVRPADIDPHWALVPLLYMFAKWTTSLVASNVKAPAPSGTSRGKATAAPA